MKPNCAFVVKRRTGSHLKSRICQSDGIMPKNLSSGLVIKCIEIKPFSLFAKKKKKKKKKKTKYFADSVKDSKDSKTIWNHLRAVNKNKKIALNNPQRVYYK